MDDYTKYRLKFAEERYNNEHEWWHQSNTLLSIYMAGLAVIIGVLFYYFKIEIGCTFFHFLSYLVITSILITVLLILYQTFRFISGHKYSYIARPSQLDAYLKELEKHYNVASTENPSIEIEEDLSSFLLDKYAESVDKNFINNRDRSKRLVKIGQYLVFTFLLVLIQALWRYIHSGLLSR